MNKTILSKEKKIEALKKEFRDMDLNNDKKIRHQEFLYQLDRKNVE